MRTQHGIIAVEASTHHFDFRVIRWEGNEAGITPETPKEVPATQAEADHKAEIRSGVSWSSCMMGSALARQNFNQWRQELTLNEPRGPSVKHPY